MYYFCYLVELDGSVKVGISADVESRIKVYGKYKNIFKVKLDGDLDYAKTIEVFVVNYFNSKTEYIKDVNFYNAQKVLDKAISLTPKTKFLLSPFNIYLTRTYDGLYKLNNVIGYVNEIRASKNKLATDIQHYTKNNCIKDFISEIKQKFFGRDVLITKNTGTWCAPHILLDFMIWSDPYLKVQCYKYMFENMEYVDFMEPFKNYKLQ